MAVATRLTWMQEKKLQNYLEKSSLAFSIRPVSMDSLLIVCFRYALDKGPTLTVIYSKDRIVMHICTRTMGKETI